MTPAQWLTKIRKLCLSLPGTTEKTSWGHPNWGVGCMYAGFGEYDGRPNVCVMASKEEQSLLVLDDRLFVPPYVGGKGWVGVWLDREPEWSLVEALLRAGHARAVQKPGRGKAKASAKATAKAPAAKKAAAKKPAAKKTASKKTPTKRPAARARKAK